MNVAEDAAALNAQAMRAMAANDPASARQILRRALTFSNELAIWLNLAGCCRALGDLQAASEAVEGALKVDARAFMALLMKASLLEQQGRLGEAAPAYGVALSQAPRDDRLDPSTLRAVIHARDINRRYVESLAAFMSQRIGGARLGGSAGESKRADLFIDMLLGRQRNYRQEPTQFFYPGLTAVGFHERENFPFLPELEQNTSEIRRELIQALEADQETFRPYIQYGEGLPLDQWTELNHSRRWSAYHLYEAGARVERTCARCPTTMEAISILPQPWVRGRSPAAMFSSLQPYTRIPPHTGIANTRLVLHLPLVVPPDCGFRVGGEVREWRVGEAWVFDDTIEHEAWNDSDEVRAVLICDVWRPDLSEVEREVIKLVMESLDDFSLTDDAQAP